MNALNDLEFQRYTGIKRKTYNKMLEILTEAHRIARTNGGVKSKFTVEEMLLIAIEYWKSNCTYFSLGVKHEISEGYCYRLVKRFENYLIKSEEFSLPDIKNEDSIVVIDSIEIDIQRPKKSLCNRKNILEKRKNIQYNYRLLSHLRLREFLI